MTLLAWLSGCKGFQKGKQLQNIISRGAVSVPISVHPTDSVRFFYSGCAGFFIQKGPDAVLNDPFLSNNGPMASLPFRRLLPDSARLLAYTQQILGSPTDKTGVIKLLTATHTHYDHVYDVPALYHQNLNQDSLLLVGSKSFRHLMKASERIYEKPVGKILAVDSLVSSADTLKNWLYSTNSRLRILPIRSSHAPHFYGVKLYGGSIRPNPRRFPECADDFKEGLSLSYLIDFLDANGHPDFRIYVQGAASQAPLGLPPSLPDHKAVDVAIVCVASYQYVRNHPEALLKSLKPRFVILSHWENFFQPGNLLENRAAVVPLTNVRKFLRRFAHHHERNTWVMPQSGTWINVRF